MTTVLMKLEKGLIENPKYENDIMKQSKKPHFQYTNWVYRQTPLAF
jgi:hypothetical protein